MLASSVPIIGDASNRLAAHRIELASDPKHGGRGIGDKRQALAGEVVEDGEDPKPPAVTQLIMQEIQRPVLVRTLRQCQRRSGAQRWRCHGNGVGSERHVG
jgi:hypothetical protein